MAKTIRYILIISFLVSCSAIWVKTADAENPKLKKLYEELMTFKDDSEFHNVGFASCCKYNQWMLSIEALRDGHKLKTLTEKNIAVDLLMLGIEYKNTRGQENAYTGELKKTIIESLE